MNTPDTFWTFVGKKLVEVYPDDKPGIYKTVDPSAYEGYIVRSPDYVFEKKPRGKDFFKKHRNIGSK